MSESPVSDPEKNVYGSDKKVVDEAQIPVYDEEYTETDAAEFGEVKELRYIQS